MYVQEVQKEFWFKVVWLDHAHHGYEVAVKNKFRVAMHPKDRFFVFLTFRNAITIKTPNNLQLFEKW